MSWASTLASSGPSIGAGNPGDVPRWETGIDRDGRLEGAGLAGDALAIEDVPGAIDDQDIVGAVAGDVGYQGRGMKSGGRLAGAGKGTATVAQQHRHCADGATVGDGEVGPAICP